MALSPDSPDHVQPVAQLSLATTAVAAPTTIISPTTTIATTIEIDSGGGADGCPTGSGGCTNVVRKKLNIDSLSQLLIDKLCAIKFDIDAVAQLLKLCCRALETYDHSRISIRTKHRLCMSLSICYFSLLEYESDNFPEILSYIRISLTCMSLLKQSGVASHILCRALLERSVVYGHLFNKNFDPYSINDRGEASSMINWSPDTDSIKLSKENLKVTLGHRFRRLPNHVNELQKIIHPRYHTPHHSNRPKSNGTDVKEFSKMNGSIGDKPSSHSTMVNGLTKIDEKKGNGSKIIDRGTTSDDTTANSGKDIPDRQSINSYLLIEAFKSSINNMEDFATLFVEFHCPVMFDKLVWSNDDALRVINEKNLSILRKFEQIPPLWDLYELIGQAGCLKSCLVLVKALIAALLAIWSSATANSCPDRTTSTARLIPPLAQSGLLPRAFGLAVEVFPHLAPSEVFSVLNDIWQYLKDTNSSLTNGQYQELSEEEKLKRAKPYLNRLRLFMCQNIPGPLYVKIFKDFYTPTSVSSSSTTTTNLDQ